MNTTAQHILDIEDALVSDENPPRDNGTLEYERCARLHNYLAAYGWMARNGKEAPELDLDALAAEKRFFHETNDEVDAIRDRLDAPLNKFLDLVYDPHPFFFYWVNGLEMMLIDEFFDVYNEMEDKERFVVIYDLISELGSYCLGVVYDQQLNRALFPMTIDNMDNVEPVKEHDEMWSPLETIFTYWIYMFQIGKVVPGLPYNELPSCDPLMSRSQFDLWSWLPYGDTQINSTIAAIERYLATVECRMPPGSLLPISAPLFTSVELDAAAVLQDCFIRLLLLQVKTPCFKFIASGLEVPYDKEAFARNQGFTSIYREEDSVLGVLLFAALNQLVDFNTEICRLFSIAYKGTCMSNREPVPAGLYSEPVRRGNYDMEKACFRLVLPFAFRPDFWRDEEGTRRFIHATLSA
ncbi:hypothetical protein N7481_000612 [Penicillium waksmanii]|uniref:uncharacterized protein n=1 Tax=Penicillium waksmanii TaxID=69791 RepID=UPI0025484676|nr:uncharacterized protein N7481_000612 [Penicillium waksmanii]KAJ6000203.1 hypothetical protein N7481_000612 [Penicillium waksmanii]